jgi:hypothetical protein
MFPMKATFATKFVGRLVGKSRQSGEFEKGDGVQIKYDDAYLIAYETPEGLVATVPVSLASLEEASDFVVASAPPYTEITVVGVVKGFDDGWTFKTIEVRKTGK